MERRVSAGELEASYKTKHELYDFFDEMMAEIFRHFERKGSSWKNCDLAFLKRELQRCVDKEDWIDAANFCFFLYDRDRERRR